MKKKGKMILLFFILVLSELIYAQVPSADKLTLVNLSHLDHLYQEVEIEGQRMAIVHIYADFPDYRWADAPGEGTACVDDIARAAVVYLTHFNDTQEQSSLLKARALVDFILYMQAPNGLFYNFVDAELHINKERINSRPEANWWTWRAAWALAEAIPCFSQHDIPYAFRIKRSIEKIYPAVDSLLSSYPMVIAKQGISNPQWLPSVSAADQASVLLFALVSVYRHFPDADLYDRIRKLSEGIQIMQLGSEGAPPYGAFLSWENLWHAWGNSQSCALLLSGELLNDHNLTESALTEVRVFHPYLLAQGFLNQFTIRIRENAYVMEDMQRYSQRAYDIRPLVWANLQAWEVSGSDDYARQGGEIACWFMGKNAAGKFIYDPETGRCFDGLDDDKKINRNAGAESTIEALLTMQKVTKNPLAYSIVSNYCKMSGLNK